MSEKEAIIKRYKGGWPILIRDKCRCQYCGFDGTKFDNWRQLTADHIIPISKGGDDREENILVACQHCNSLKSNWRPETDESGLDREKSISEIRKYLSEKIEKIRPEFLLMMDEIRKKEQSIGEKENQNC